MSELNIRSSDESQLVVFKIANEEFGVNIHQVREIVRLVPITPIPRSPDFIEGVVNLRGQILAVIDLAKRLDLPPRARTEGTRIIVVEFEEKTVGMIVDEVTEVLRLANNQIDHTPEIIDTEIQQKYITGVGKLEDKLLILIDLKSVLSTEEIDHLDRIEAAGKAAAAKKSADTDLEDEDSL